MARKKIGEMLVEAGVITEQTLRMALNEQRRWGGAVGKILIEMKALSEAELVRCLSQQLSLPSVEVDTLDIHPTVLELVPGELAEQYSIIPFRQQMKFLDVAMADPTNLGIIDELRIRTQLNIRPYLAGPKMIERGLAKFYRRGLGRMYLRTSEMTVPDLGDTVALATEPSPAPRSRPDTAEIAAARRREGLPPAAPRSGRQTGLEVPMVQSQQTGPVGPPDLALGRPGASRDAEIDALQDRISALEALVARDEDVLRKLLGLLVEKGVASRDEILERIR